MMLELILEVVSFGGFYLHMVNHNVDFFFLSLFLYFFYTLFKDEKSSQGQNSVKQHTNPLNDLQV